MKSKFTGSTTVAVMLFVTSGMLASMLGIRQMEKLSQVTAVVVSSDIISGQVITADMLSTRKVHENATTGSIQNPRNLIGKRVSVDKKAGEAIFPKEVKKVKAVSISQSVPEGRVLFTLKQPQGGIPFSQLHQGDRLDILARGKGAVRVVARDVQLIGIIKSSNSSDQQKGMMDLLKPGATNVKSGLSGVSLVMAVRPGDVYPLASLGGQELVSLVLHSAHDVAKGKQQLISMVKTHREIEVVSGVTRNTVKVRR